MARPFFTITGDRQVAATLGELGRTIGGAALDASMSKGMRLLRSEVKNEYIRSGAWGVADAWGPGTPAGLHLAENIKTVKEKGRPRNNPLFKLGGSGRRAQSIMHLVEYGTAPHWQPKRKWMHPGAKANPVIRRTFEAQKEAVTVLVLRDLKVQAGRALSRATAGKKSK